MSAGSVTLTGVERDLVLRLAIERVQGECDCGSDISVIEHRMRNGESESAWQGYEKGRAELLSLFPLVDALRPDGLDSYAVEDAAFVVAMVTRDRDCLQHDFIEPADEWNREYPDELDERADTDRPIVASYNALLERLDGIAEVSPLTAGEGK